MTDHEHNWKPHPNHGFIRCADCGQTLDDAIDELLAEAGELLDPQTPGTATERQGEAMRALVKAKRLEREYE